MWTEALSGYQIRDILCKLCVCFKMPSLTDSHAATAPSGCACVECAHINHPRRCIPHLGATWLAFEHFFQPVIRWASYWQIPPQCCFHVCLSEGASLSSQTWKHHPSRVIFSWLAFVLICLTLCWLFPQTDQAGVPSTSPLGKGHLVSQCNPALITQRKPRGIAAFFPSKQTSQHCWGGRKAPF